MQYAFFFCFAATAFCTDFRLDFIFSLQLNLVVSNCNRNVNVKVSLLQIKLPCKGFQKVTRPSNLMIDNKLNDVQGPHIYLSLCN